MTVDGLPGVFGSALALAADPTGDTLSAVPGTGLGILRQPDGVAPAPSSNFARLSPAARALARSPAVLNLTKANSRSTVHRPSRNKPNLHAAGP